MRIISGTVQLSASDLSNHIACQHCTFLDLAATHGIIKPFYYEDPRLDVLIERGVEFEKKYLDSLKADGYIIDEGSDSVQSGIDRTLAAMKNGADFIYQAALTDGIWHGRADILQKVNKPSALGSWSYEVIDSKLARNTKAGTILQIALYSEMLAKLQDKLPEYMHVITPENNFTKEPYRVDHYMAYLRFVKRRLFSAIERGADKETTYPLPVEHCDICRWWKFCDDRRRKDDHLSLVAGLSNLNTVEINKWKIITLEAFAKVSSPIKQKPSRGTIDTYERLKEQARVQLIARENGKPYYEMIEQVLGQGLYKLPAPSKGDVFFDFEGDPFVGNNGLEYLFGWVAEENGTIQYNSLSALSPDEEKRAFEEFIDMMMLRWKQFPDMHIYHFTSYEPSALKRLMGKYATREDEMDSMLRADLFVDLHNVIKHTVRAGIERYSLKELEIFHEFDRKLELRHAASSLRDFEIMLERNAINDLSAELIEDVKTYNQDDCASTKSLRDWLERLLVKVNVDLFPPISRPIPGEEEVSENITDHQTLIKPLFEKLTDGISADPKERNANPTANALWLLANMLDWYRREKKSTWWELFRLSSLATEEFLDEKSAIAYLQFTGKTSKEKRSDVHEYSFPEQDTDIREGDKVRDANGEEVGEVVSIDMAHRSIRLKKKSRKVDVHPIAIFKFKNVEDKVKEGAIIRIASWVVEHGMDAPGPSRSGRDLLLRNAPRTIEAVDKNAAQLDLALQWVRALDNSVLSIQGPPGTGKSHTAAHIALQLIKDKKKIGITALSHKVIRNLLKKIIQVAEKEKVKVTCIEKIGDDPEPAPDAIIEAESNDEVLRAIQLNEVHVAAGTAWMWAREDFAEAVDVLIVDEAGQLSLIDTVAVSQAAKNLVLLGDPQQLKQPQKGCHPEGTDVSALEHMLNGHETIPEEIGIFLKDTWRMHPSITQFISEQFYEGRLNSIPSLANQKLDGNTKYQPAGLWFESVEHQGNQSSSIEEVNRVNEMVRELIKGDVYWNDREGNRRPLAINDILIIAPYNAQVFALLQKLPEGARVGTVDKFQGQEAPVVIYSITTSTAQDAPRGMEFLFSGNRLNVAVSRARAVSILVGNPRIFEPECKNPHQMQLANAFCRYLEMITEP